MFIARNLISAFAAAAIASSTAVTLCPSAAADPAPPAPIPVQQVPGLPALTELSPIIQQAAGNPEQATQLLMAAASAFASSPTAPDQSKSVAASVNQFVQAPNAAVPADLNQPPGSAPTAHIVPPGVEPGAQAHLPTGIDPVHAAGPGPEAAPAPANAVPVAAAVPPAGPALAAPAGAPAAPRRWRRHRTGAMCS